MTNNIELVNRAKELLKERTTFVWGANGEYLDEHIIYNAVLNYPKRYDSELIRKLHEQIGVRCFECTGVVKACCEYDEDIRADEMYKRATERGLIDTLPELPGVLVHMSGHCGIYIGEGRVIEATYNPLFGFGVIETKLSDRDWLCWYKCHWITYN